MRVVVFGRTACPHRGNHYFVGKQFKVIHRKKDQVSKPLADEVMDEANNVVAETSSVQDAAAQPSDVGACESDADLREKLANAEARIAELEDLYKRSLADAENTRRRARQDVQDARQYGIERWAHELVEVKDNLERALAVPETASIESLRTGVELTLKQLTDAFSKVNLVDIDPKDEKFDPNLHQAMSVISAPLPAKTIVDVLRKGYKLGDRVIRPAQVVIAKDEEENPQPL